MRLIYIFLFTTLICGSLSAGTPFGERLKGWLPDFLTEWFFSVEEPDQESISLEEAQALPGAEQWLDLPTPTQNDQKLHWPQVSLTLEADVREYERARATTRISRDTEHFLPISAGVPLRLIHGSGGEPYFLVNLLRTFAPLKSIAYQSKRDQGLLAVSHPEALNVLFIRAHEPTDKVNPWYLDFFNLPAIVVVENGALMREKFPDHWIVISGDKLNAHATQLRLTDILYNPQEELGRVLTYAAPGEGNFDFEKLEKVDAYVNRAIRRRATPGAQLLVTRAGKIVYQKSYGYHTYRKKQDVYTSDLYDLASITKSAATTLAVMWLYERGEVQLDGRVKDYLPSLEKSPAGRYTLEQLLTHQTGIQSNLPLSKFLGSEYLHDRQEKQFTIPVSANRWLDESVPEQILAGIQSVEYSRSSIYRYSDVNYYLLQQIVEKVSERKLDELLTTEVYRPIGLQRLGFNPAQNFKVEQMVPTSRDYWLRNGLVRGYVHDEGAALLGGVAGHAGLFATATDLAQLYQMLLNGGEYNGKRIFSEQTVKLFTSRSSLNYRALGFDRLAGGWNTVIKAGASEQTFGHTGFSGTCVWADPENDLVFVLLTNRIHPDPDNDRLQKIGTRGQVHLQVYRSMLEPDA